MDELTPATLLFLHYTNEKSPWFQSALNELRTQRPGKFELVSSLRNTLTMTMANNRQKFYALAIYWLRDYSGGFGVETLDPSGLDRFDAIYIPCSWD
jgi:hypothetical protein